ncbi:hypothetical protein [Longispora albida]|uniref:hypothetical protein n=1 Tax=Longispora albida TaxID=203523 RepID=UPI00035C16CC|nr:hypothetical protein [Longispora albida]
MSKTFRAVALAGLATAAVLAVPQAAQATQGCSSQGYPTGQSFKIYCYIHNNDNARAAVKCFRITDYRYMGNAYGQTVTVGPSTASCWSGTEADEGWVDYSV